jgi:hypothetical protein
MPPLIGKLSPSRSCKMYLLPSVSTFLFILLPATYHHHSWWKGTRDLLLRNIASFFGTQYQWKPCADADQILHWFY